MGDGESDEPESLSELALAAREGLDNIVMTMNCNLQRLDGPVRGNSKIVQELEGRFRGAGWNVIKVLWGSSWDALFAKDTSGTLAKRLADLVDGDEQRLFTAEGAIIRKELFAGEELTAMVADYSDEELEALTEISAVMISSRFTLHMQQHAPTRDNQRLFLPAPSRGTDLVLLLQVVIQRTRGRRRMRTICV